MRGDGYDGVVLDEAAFMHQDVWTKVIRPAIEDRGGWCIFLTTPNGLNWFHDLFLSKKTDHSGRWECWQRPSSENPLMSAEALAETIDEIGPRSYQQEFEAKFVSQDGAIWGAEYFGDWFWLDDWPADTYTTQIAVDPSLGKTEQSDYSAIVVGKLDITTGLIALSADIERRDPTKLCEDIVTIAMRERPDWVTLEGNGFQSVLMPEISRIAYQRGYMIPIRCTYNKIEKTARIKGSWTPYLNQKVIRLVGRHRGNKLLYDQLVNFPLKGHHDDGPDAGDMVIRAMWDYVTSPESESTEVIA